MEKLKVFRSSLFIEKFRLSDHIATTLHKYEIPLRSPHYARILGRFKSGLRNPLFCYMGLCLMDEAIQKIKELILPLFQGEHRHLVDLEVRGKSGSQVISVYADTKDGITLDEITRLTREINDLLDTHDVIQGVYRLDVSSPGADRPLKALWEFEKNVGRDLRVIFEDNGEENEATGKLSSVDETRVLLKLKNKDVAIPMASIKKAQVKLKW